MFLIDMKFISKLFEMCCLFCYGKFMTSDPHLHKIILLRIGDWGVLNREIVSFRLCVRTRGLVA